MHELGGLRADSIPGLTQLVLTNNRLKNLQVCPVASECCQCFKEGFNLSQSLTHGFLLVRAGS